MSLRGGRSLSLGEVMAHSVRYFKFYDSFWDDALTCKMFARCGYPGVLILTALWTSAIQILWDDANEQQEFETPLAVLSTRIRKGKSKTLAIIHTLSEENSNFSYSFSKEKGTVTFQYPAFVRIHSGLANQRKKGADSNPKGNPEGTPKAPPKGTTKVDIIDQKRLDQKREEIREEPPLSPTRPLRDGTGVTVLLGVVEKACGKSPGSKETGEMRRYLDSLIPGYGVAKVQEAILAYPDHYPERTWPLLRYNLENILKGGSGPLARAKASSFGKDIVEHNTRSARASIFEIDVPEAS